MKHFYTKNTFGQKLEEAFSATKCNTNYMIDSAFFNKDRLFFLGMMTLIFGLSIWSPSGHFTGTPKYWWDESFTIENARTLLETGGRPDFTVAPNTPSMMPALVHANGFPLVLSTAAFFSIFDVGLTQARVFMILWILATSISLFFILKSFFDKQAAYAGTLLVTTFASFYANGRTLTGDIPGFFFLLWGLWLIIEKKYYLFGGVILGLAAVTKISVFHMILPAIGIAILIIKKADGIKPLLKIATGSILVGIIWWLLMFPHPLNISEISETLSFFKEPYHKASMIDRLPNSLVEFTLSSTAIYFAILASLIIYSIKKYSLSDKEKILFVFSGIYILLQFYVFFKSPGWNRYLIVSELLILMLLYPSLTRIIKNKRIISISVTFLLSMQIVQYLYFSNIFSLESPTRNAYAINNLLEREPDSTIGFINNPMDAALVASSRKYQTVHVGGKTFIGKNPLDYSESELPTYIFAGKEIDHPNIFLYEYLEITGEINMWKRKN
ncbi:MAG: glycosyltransferase family 39 protein [bacterium]|nr:glycosyltransferase family 39 protein [bacterium]